MQIKFKFSEKRSDLQHSYFNDILDFCFALTKQSDFLSYFQIIWS